MPRKKSIPSLRYHVSGQSVVTFCGKNFYLGPHDSVEAHARYHALVAEYIANGMTAPPEQPERQSDAPVTIRCLTAECRRHVQAKYAKNKQELDRFTNLCGTLEDLHGDEPASAFGPRKLSELRDLFVASGNCRTYANRQTRNVVTIFKFGVSRELIKPEQLVALRSLEPLRYGQTEAKESEPVVPGLPSGTDPDNGTFSSGTGDLLIGDRALLSHLPSHRGQSTSLLPIGDRATLLTFIATSHRDDDLAWGQTPTTTFV